MKFLKESLKEYREEIMEFQKKILKKSIKIIRNFPQESRWDLIKKSLVDFLNDSLEEHLWEHFFKKSIEKF